jgi:hypothetical protein
MGSQRIFNPQKIIKIIDHLILKKLEIYIIIKGVTGPFHSKVLKVELDQPSLAKGTKSIIIIDKLLPENGNSLIQSSEKINLRFVIAEQTCTCSVNYIGISSLPPFFGFMLSLPEIIEIEERRIEKREVYEPPDFLLAQICLEKGTKNEKNYELDVIDCAAHGLGMLIRPKHFDLLKRIKVGDKLKDVQFYASNAMLKVDGVVRHITKAGEGKYKGNYYVGIESKDIIPNSKTPK